MEDRKVSFLGLGVMGYPMAGHLSKAGYNVTIYNRTESKSDSWLKEYKGSKALTPREAVKDSKIVFACVGNDNDIKDICIGNNGAFLGMDKGAIFVDNTTASADIARELYKTAKNDYSISFLDAPVSGGEAGAVNGALTVMVGGDKNVFHIAKPYIDAYSQAVTLMGNSGAGQLTKMVNQICIAGLLQGLSEGVKFGMLSGLDIKKVVEVISKGAAGSWQMVNRAETMSKGEFDFGFAIELMHKDLQICINESSKNNANLPITKLIDEFYKNLINKGYNRNDTSSLIRLL
ncbi:MAG: 2-hydroxy-3-oxopropionate reductase [Alphaproteobacteria bacterium MarineAlpha9_Bin3]|nr:MAG: 2-hydroxy-3-oxopropionate reductase [Alphaproteobacteria bacterium MarineAlpha9_Bin3]|tara:strand:+ start:1181 stop:2050 length:870 start_codon:yes stop_codon:yes gene_type:complete